MQSLDEDIKNGSFRSVYLLVGTEEYLKSYYKKRLTLAMSDPEDTMNYSYYEGKGIEVPALIDMAETMPFFKDRRLIVIENSGFFKNSCEELAEYIKAPSETTNFIFVESECDKRGKLYKAVSAAGKVVELNEFPHDKLLRWAAGILAKNNKQIRQSTLEYLITKSGTDMNTLNSELNKLIDYTGDRNTIENADVDAVCTVELKNHIFDMTDAMSCGQQKKALDLYYELLALKEPPMRIMYLIARQFNLMLQAKELARSSSDQKYLGQQLGLNPFIARKYADRARKYSASRLREIVEACIETEAAVKTGKLDDRLSVELIIVKYSSNNVQEK